MVRYFISICLGFPFALASIFYVWQLPCIGQACAIFIVFAILVPATSGDRTALLMSLYGSGMSSLGIYIFITSILFGPGMFPPDLFYSGGPRPSFCWVFLRIWLFWLGTAMALRGIILGVRDENASTRQSENGENDHRGA